MVDRAEDEYEKLVVAAKKEWELMVLGSLADEFQVQLENMVFTGDAPECTLRSGNLRFRTRVHPSKPI